MTFWPLTSSTLNEEVVENSNVSTDQTRRCCRRSQHPLNRFNLSRRSCSWKRRILDNICFIAEAVVSFAEGTLRKKIKKRSSTGSVAFLILAMPFPQNSFSALIEEKECEADCVFSCFRRILLQPGPEEILSQSTTRIEFRRRGVRYKEL